MQANTEQASRISQAARNKTQIRKKHPVYKVVEEVNNKYLSVCSKALYRISANLVLEYKLNCRTYSNIGGILVFDWLYHARLFKKQCFQPESIRILECQYGKIVPLPNDRFDIIYQASEDEISRVWQEEIPVKDPLYALLAPWPSGTIAVNWVKPIEIVD